MLVPTTLKDLPWLKLFESAIAAQGRFWGGSGNLMFPLTDDLADREIFWAIGDCFDADAYVTYAPTWGEMREFAPTVVEGEMDRLRRKVTSQIDATAAEEFIARLEDETALDFRPRDEQLQLIKRRLAPFHSEEGPWSLDTFSGSAPAAWPFMDATRFADLPRKIQTVATSGAARQLLLTTVAGRVPLGLRLELAERGIEVTDGPPSRGYVRAGTLVDRRHGEAPTGSWAISEHGLGLYRRGRWGGLPAALVVGDSPWDFALYYALKRMTGMAWWLPSWLTRDKSYLFALGSALRYDARREGRSLAVVSASSVKVRDRVALTIDDLVGQPVSATATDWHDVLPEEPLRFYARDNEGRTHPVQLVDGEETLPLDTPIPARVATDEPTEMRWISEVQGYNWAPVRHHRVGPRLLSGMYSSADLVRATRDGVAYFAPASMIFTGASLESVVVRPSLKPLGLVEQLGAVLEPVGWACELSDKGIYASEAMQLFGGFDDLCAALRDQRIRRVIDAYQNKRAPGRSLSQDDRRYLTWGSFEQLLPDQPVAPVVDPLLARGVLSRGLVLKCRRCRQEAWHRISDVGDHFTCGRCHLGQRTERMSWLGTDEPVWSYRLAEVIFQFLAHDGELPLLAVHDEFEGSGRPLAHAYELDLLDPEGKRIEVDIFSADGYRLWIGEAKKNGRFEPGRLDTIAGLASLLDAYGILLATAQPKWPPSTKVQARASFSGFWPRVRMVAGVRTGP
jgi:hypothetical protein